MAAEATSITPGPDQLAALIRQTAIGHPDGIEGLYRLYAERLFRLAARLTGSVQDGEDVVQDVFVGLPEAVRSFQGRGSFDGWLKRVTARVALMRLRSNRRRREESIDERSAFTSQPSEDRGERDDIQKLIAKLPDTLRIVLVLRQIEGYSHEEIGALLGISGGASRVRFSRAVDLLRRRLKEIP